MSTSATSATDIQHSTKDSSWSEEKANRSKVQSNMLASTDNNIFNWAKAGGAMLSASTIICFTSVTGSSDTSSGFWALTLSLNCQTIHCFSMDILQNSDISVPQELIKLASWKKVKSLSGCEAPICISPQLSAWCQASPTLSSTVSVHNLCIDKSHSALTWLAFYLMLLQDRVLIDFQPEHPFLLLVSTFSQHQQQQEDKKGEETATNVREGKKFNWRCSMHSHKTKKQNGVDRRQEIVPLNSQTTRNVQYSKFRT